jgi:Domain of unknown function (DUF4124)
MERIVSRRMSTAAALLAALAAAGLLASGSGAVAQTVTTYRWVDAQGVVHYQDTPKAGAQIIQLQSAQTYRAPPLPSAASRAATAATQQDPASPYQSCGIAEPAPETSLFAPDTVPISVSIAPGLRPGDQVVLTVDGSALEPAAGGQQYQVAAPERGAHTITAIVRDPDGKPVCRAVPVTFYVQRPSLLSPTSPARGH